MPIDRRAALSGTCHFLTVAVAAPHASLFTRHVGALAGALRELRQVHRFRLIAHVLLPDHLHALVACAPGTEAAALWPTLDALFARNLARDACDAAVAMAPRPHWIYPVEDAREVRHLVDRIHSDPLRHGLVARPVFWPWSSFARHVRAGVYAPNWCGAASVAGPVRRVRAGIAERAACYAASAG